MGGLFSRKTKNLQAAKKDEAAAVEPIGFKKLEPAAENDIVASDAGTAEDAPPPPPDSPPPPLEEEGDSAVLAVDNSVCPTDEDSVPMADGVAVETDDKAAASTEDSAAPVAEDSAAPVASGTLTMTSKVCVNNHVNLMCDN